MLMLQKVPGVKNGNMNLMRVNQTIECSSMGNFSGKIIVPTVYVSSYT